MKHFFIIVNGHKDCSLEKTNYIKNYLQEHNGTCSVQSDTDPPGIPEDVECIIVLGGDGTLLQAARDTVDRDIPLLGINLGTLGYLAEVEETGIDQALNRLLADEYEVEQRMMLTGKAVRGSIHERLHEEKAITRCKEEKPYALNDIAITRSGSLQIIKYEIWVNGQFLNEYQADGVIVATPTGSTGYNLSAGGPIVEPRAKLLLVTPICPHTLNTRSIILSPEDRVEIEIGTGREESIQQVEVNFDGSRKLVLYTGDKVLVEKAATTTGIVKLNKVSFLDVLHRKLSD